MADETAEGGAVEATKSSGDDVRNAFLSGKTDEDAVEETEKPVADDDSDLDDEDTDADVEETEDEDADLDDEPEEEKPDADRDKRLETVKRTDKRLREQRDKDFAARDAEFAQRVAAVEKEWTPRIEAAEKFERLAQRASVDPVAVLKALGVGEDRYEYVGKLLYTLSKAKDDPKARAEAAHFMKQSEVDAELADLKKWREERERTDKERSEQAEQDRNVEAFISKVTAAATDKTPLARAFIKSDLSEAKERIQVIAFRLAKEAGRLPSEKQVMVAFEKERRGLLRKMGIDPKSISATAANAAIEKKKPTVAATKKPAGKPAVNDNDDDSKPLSREEYARMLKYD